MKPPRSPDTNNPQDVRKHIEQVNKVLSNISFGSTVPTSTPSPGNAVAINDPDSNMEGNKFYVAFPVAANTDITIKHNLGRVPTGWLVLRAVNQGMIYLSPTAPTATTITLRETQGSQIAILHFL